MGQHGKKVQSPYQEMRRTGSVHCSEFYLIRNNVLVSHNGLSAPHMPAALVENSQHLRKKNSHQQPGYLGERVTY